MAISSESNDLVYDTEALRECGKKYSEVADTLDTLCNELDTCLKTLANTSWTTGAGKSFQKMVETNWQHNIKRYVDLLKTLDDIIQQAAGMYEDLSVNHIEKTQL